MKGLLLLLGVGAAIYTLLIYTHDLLPNGKGATQTEPNHSVARHLSSWGAYLPSLRQDQPSAALPSQPNTTYERRWNDPSQNSELKPGSWYQLAATEAKKSAADVDGAAPVEGDPSTAQAALESTTRPGPAKAASPKSKKWSQSSKHSKRAVRASNTRSTKATVRARSVRRVSRWDPWNVPWQPPRY